MRIFETHSKKAIYMYVKPFYDRSHQRQIQTDADRGKQ